MELKKLSRKSKQSAPEITSVIFVGCGASPGRALSSQVLLRGQCKKAEDQSVHGQ